MPGPKPHPPSSSVQASGIPNNFTALFPQALTYLRQAPKRRAGKHDCHYPEQVKGNFQNWGYGKTLSSTLHLADEWTLTLRSQARPFTVIREHITTTTTKRYTWPAGWHIHTPAERAIDTSRTRAELHLVHLD